jgi:hypothetical protein
MAYGYYFIKKGGGKMLKRVLVYSLVFVFILLEVNIGYTETSYVGIGVFTELNNNQVVVNFVVDGSPAQRAGIKPGDIIIKVDDKPIEGMNINDVSKLIRGPVGTEVKLTIQREGEPEPINFSITRTVIDLRLALAPKMIKLYDDTVILTQVPRWAEHSIDVFLNKGDIVFYRFLVEQGDFVRRDINFYIMDKYNFSCWKSKLNWKAYILRENVTNLDDMFIAPESGKYYLVFYNPSTLFNKKVSIEIKLVKVAKETPTTSVQTSVTRQENIYLPDNWSNTISIQGMDFYRYGCKLDDNFEIDFRIGATQPINFYIMGSYDFEKWIEARQMNIEKFATYKKYQGVTQLHDIFIAPIRDKYYFVFENTQAEPVTVYCKFNFSK